MTPPTLASPRHPDPIRREATERLRERYGFSDEEAAIAALLLRGCSNAEIAARSGVDPTAVAERVRHILEKLLAGRPADPPGEADPR